MASPILAMRHSTLGRNHLQTLKWFRKGGWTVSLIPSGYRIAHPAFGTLPAPIELELRAFPSSDLDALQQIFIEMQYLSAVQTMLQHSPACHDPLIIDGGANIGLCSVFLGRLFPKHHIIAIEPLPSNVEQLKQNIRLSQTENVTIFEGALWGHAASLGLNLEHGDRREWAASVQEGETSGTIQGKTIEQLSSMYYPGAPIDLLKLDIEGAEFSVLNDPATESFIARNVRVLTMELHPGFGDIEALVSRYKKHFVLEKSGEGLAGYNRSPIA